MCGWFSEAVVPFSSEVTQGVQHVDRWVGGWVGSYLGFVNRHVLKEKIHETDAHLPQGPPGPVGGRGGWVGGGSRLRLGGVHFALQVEEEGDEVVEGKGGAAGWGRAGGLSG